MKEKVVTKNNALGKVTIQAPKGGGLKRVILEKPSIEMTRHIRPLYIKAHLNGKPISRVLIDDRSVVNVIPSRMLAILGRTEEDLIPTNVTVSAFTGEVTKVLVVLPIEIIVGSKTSLTAFFIVNSSASYNVLLGRDWIHANGCVPSSLYQFLLFWKGDDVEVIWANPHPFSTHSDAVEARYYDVEFGLIQFLGKKKNGEPKSIYMSGSEDVQKQAKVLINPTTIVPYRPMAHEPIIELLDD